MLERGLVTVAEIRRAFDEIKPKLIRFPAVEPDFIENGSPRSRNRDDRVRRSARG